VREVTTRTMKPLYVSATKQDTGKTTLIVGLLNALRDQGLDVGYMKPVGQRYVQYEGCNVDEDAVLAREVFGLRDAPADLSTVAIERGFTAHYIFNRDPKPLEAKIRASFERLHQVHPYMLVEGTGHAGVGSCFDLSNARVAELFGASAIIIAKGGIGQAIDEAALSLHLFQKHGVEVLGVVLNKVWPEKLDKIREAVAKGLENLGTRLLGVVPYQPTLVYPQMDQVAAEVGGRILCGEANLANRVKRTVVAAMEPEHVAIYLRPDTLMILPGDRVDNMEVALSAPPVEPGGPRPVVGLVLTGGFEPPAPMTARLREAGIPTILCEQDTFSVAAALQEMRFKMRSGDRDKIQEVERLVRESVDIDVLKRAMAGG